MDPRKPQWKAADARRRSARMWKVLVGVAAAAAATTVIVASCHDLRNRARPELAAPGYVETTGAEVTGADVSVAGVGVEPAVETTATVVSPIVTAPLVTAPPPVTVIPPTPAPAPGPAAATGAPPSTNDSAGGTTTDAGPAPTAVPTAVPTATPAGAGRFITEAPYWGSSAFPSNPEAGAGPFTP